MPRRVDRINGLLRQEISQVLARHIKDPRLDGVITITEVQTSGDLRNALVLISVMGDDEAKRSALEGIQSRRGVFEEGVARTGWLLRYTPFLRFALDDSMEQADRVLQMMDQIPAAPDSYPQEGAPSGRPKNPAVS